MRKWWVVRHLKCLWLLETHLGFQQWEMSLAKSLISLINRKMLPLHLIDTCLFSYSLFYNWCHVPSHPTLALSPSLSLRLYATFSFCPLFHFDIKSSQSNVKSYHCLTINVCRHIAVSFRGLITINARDN